MKQFFYCALIFGMVCPFPLFAENISPDQRFERLERKISTLTDLTLRFDKLQKENRDLRGQIETLQYQLETLKKKQRDLYVDIDQRISNFQTKPTEIKSDDLISESSQSNQNLYQQNLNNNSVSENQLNNSLSTPNLALKRINPKKIRSDYKKAYELIGPSQRRYEDAAIAFSEFLNNYPTSNLAANAQYWLAETYYVRQKNVQALAEFQKVIDRYPDSSKVPGALYKIGRLQFISGDVQKARDVLKRLVSDFPKAPATGLAKELFKKIGS